MLVVPRKDATTFLYYPLGESAYCELRFQSLDSPQEHLPGDLLSNKDCQKESRKHKVVY